jgi:hypothetical protein
MSEIQRIQIEPLPQLRPVDWASVKIASGAVMTARAHEGIANLRERIWASGQTDELDMLLLQSYAFGAAELIQRYMNTNKRGDVTL